MGFSSRDIEVVHGLAARLMEAASQPVQDEKREMWRKLNGLEAVRPMVWINEIPWWEFEDNEHELVCRCEDGFARDLERELRRTLYLWDHMRTDMVVDPVLYSNYEYRDTGFGLEVDAVGGRFEDGFGAHEYVPVIRNEDDIAKIRMPRC